MAWGRQVPKGYLPVFSVGTMKEAKDLVVLCCGTNMHGEYIAKELVMDQTLENLYAFGDRLEKGHEFLKKAGGCTCKEMK